MSSINVRVEYPDGTTDTLTHIYSAIKEEFNKQDVMTVTVPRAEVQGLTADQDEIYLEVDGEDVFGPSETRRGRKSYTPPTRRSITSIRWAWTNPTR